MRNASACVTVSALLFAACGAAFLFAPEPVGSSVAGSTSTNSLFIQLFGAALIGFGAANWIARRSPLGGIYGRAIVAGSQAFSLVAALVLVRRMPSDAGWGFWMLLVMLIGSAVLYSVLLFGSAAKKQV